MISLQTVFLVTFGLCVFQTQIQNLDANKCSFFTDYPSLVPVSYVQCQWDCCTTFQNSSETACCNYDNRMDIWWISLALAGGALLCILIFFILLYCLCKDHKPTRKIKREEDNEEEEIDYAAMTPRKLDMIDFMGVKKRPLKSNMFNYVNNSVQPLPEYKAQHDEETANVDYSMFNTKQSEQGKGPYQRFNNVGGNDLNYNDEYHYGIQNGFEDDVQPMKPYIPNSYNIGQMETKLSAQQALYYQQQPQQQPGRLRQQHEQQRSFGLDQRAPNLQSLPQYVAMQPSNSNQQQYPYNNNNNNNTNRQARGFDPNTQHGRMDDEGFMNQPMPFEPSAYNVAQLNSQIPVQYPHHQPAVYQHQQARQFGLDRPGPDLQPLPQYLTQQGNHSQHQSRFFNVRPQGLDPQYEEEDNSQAVPTIPGSYTFGHLNAQLKQKQHQLPRGFIIGQPGPFLEPLQQYAPHDPHNVDPIPSIPAAYSYGQLQTHVPLRKAPSQPNLVKYTSVQSDQQQQQQHFVNGSSNDFVRLFAGHGGVLKMNSSEDPLPVLPASVFVNPKRRRRNSDSSVSSKGKRVINNNLNINITQAPNVPVISLDTPKDTNNFLFGSKLTVDKPENDKTQPFNRQVLNQTPSVQHPEPIDQSNLHGIAIPENQSSTNKAQQSVKFRKLVEQMTTQSRDTSMSQYVDLARLKNAESKLSSFPSKEKLSAKNSLVQSDKHTDDFNMVRSGSFKEPV